MTMHRLAQALLLAALASGAAQAAPRYAAGPYKYTAMHRQATHVLSDAAGKPVFGPGTVSWAFATGECGAEVWDTESAQDVAAANVAAFAAAGADYIVSTGGQGGLFTCSSDAGMEAFLARYMSKNLVGIDFDMEHGQTPEQIDAIVARAVAAQARHPALRFSFTVATHAASDGSRKSLNQLGETILASVRKGALRDFVINLMVMDYGPPAPENCVVRGTVCDMGASAVQAVRNVHAKYALPYEQIAVTAMIGVNDVPNNDFTRKDARVLARAVRKLKLAGMHYWSLDRDLPCPVPAQGASATCSGMPDAAGAFGRILAR
jgi:chitinase